MKLTRRSPAPPVGACDHMPLAGAPGGLGIVIAAKTLDDTTLPPSVVAASADGGLPANGRLPADPAADLEHPAPATRASPATSATITQARRRANRLAPGSDGPAS